MSINFHAYQCKDYLLSDYEEIEKQWKSTFSDFYPERVMHILNLERDENWLYIRYYETLFRLRLADGTLEKEVREEENDISRSPSTPSPSAQPHSIQSAPARSHSSRLSSYVALDDPKKLYRMEPAQDESCDNGWSRKIYFNEAMVIYHLLHYVKDEPAFQGVWIPNTELDTRAARNNQREDLLFTSFAKGFSGRLEELETACQKANGTPVESKADIAYQFQVFPQVPLRLLFWDQDEDFPAQVQVLVDKSITDYVHLETTGCMISDLFVLLNSIL